MNIQELIEQLVDYADDFGNEVEVRLMTQENWPFENELVGLVSSDQLNEADESGDELDPTGDDVVYLIEGRQLKYGNKLAWDFTN